MRENHTNPGQQAYEDYWAKQMADSEFRAIYEEEAAKKEQELAAVTRKTGATEEETQ